MASASAITLTAHVHEHEHEHPPHSHDFGEDYAGALEEFRHMKDHAFAGNPQSPIPEEEREAFQGLAYYPPDPALRVVATLEAHADPKTVVMQTSDGQQTEFRNVGHFPVTIRGESADVQAYRGAHGELFMPFRDKTSGKETYGAGRYLDLEWSGTGVPYVIDFNLAYNPSCAYNEAYSCPFPPPENWLAIAIPAGEKTYNAPEG